MCRTSNTQEANKSFNLRATLKVLVEVSRDDHMIIFKSPSSCKKPGFRLQGKEDYPGGYRLDNYA